MREWISEHPYLTGIGAVAIVLLVVLFRRGSGSPSVNSYSSVGDAAIQSGNQLQMAQLQQQTQIAGFNAAVNAYQLQAAAQIEQARLQSNVQLAYIAAASGQQTTQGGGGTPTLTTPAPTVAGVVYGMEQQQQSQQQQQQAQQQTFQQMVTQVPEQPFKAGETWNDYYNSYSHIPANDFNTQDVNSQYAQWVKAYNSWVWDPNSPHNKVAA